MKTRNGTTVTRVNCVDGHGYCLALLAFDEGSPDEREIHLSDLRTETPEDERRFEELNQQSRTERTKGNP